MSQAPAPGPPLELLTALWVVVIWSFTWVSSDALIWVASFFCVSLGWGVCSCMVKGLEACGVVVYVLLLQAVA